MVRPLLPKPTWLEGRGGAGRGGQPEEYCHRQMLVRSAISWRAGPPVSPIQTNPKPRVSQSRLSERKGRGPEKQPLDSVRRVRRAAALVDPPGRSRAHRANALPPLWSLVAPQPVEGDDALSGHARVRVGGTHAEADAVIWCTGFRPPFPTSPRSNSAADVASPPPAPARVDEPRLHRVWITPR